MWQRLLRELDGPLLDERKLCLVPDTLRLYALHRMIRARARLADLARQAAGFDLNRAIASGLVDVGTGKVIDLELRVRGYAVEVLRVCPLTPAQRIEDEPADSPFLARVWARVPETGALWRWLLGLRANVEVVGPPALRQGIQEQTLRAAHLYARLSVLGKDSAGQSEQGQDTPGHGKPPPPPEGEEERLLMSDW